MSTLAVLIRKGVSSFVEGILLDHASQALEEGFEQDRKVGMENARRQKGG